MSGLPIMGVSRNGEAASRIDGQSTIKLQTISKQN